MPGIKESDIAITLEKNVLMLNGEFEDVTGGRSGGHPPCDRPLTNDNPTRARRG